MLLPAAGLKSGQIRAQAHNEDALTRNLGEALWWSEGWTLVVTYGRG